MKDTKDYALNQLLIEAIEIQDAIKIAVKEANCFSEAKKLELELHAQSLENQLKSSLEKHLEQSIMAMQEIAEQKAVDIMSPSAKNFDNQIKKVSYHVDLFASDVRSLASTKITILSSPLFYLSVSVILSTAANLVLPKLLANIFS